MRARLTCAVEQLVACLLAHCLLVVRLTLPDHLLAAASAYWPSSQRWVSGSRVILQARAAAAEKIIELAASNTLANI